MIKTITKKHFCDIQPSAFDSRAWGVFGVLKFKNNLSHRET